MILSMFCNPTIEKILTGLTYFQRYLHAVLGLFLRTAMGTMKDEVWYVFITIAERTKICKCFINALIVNLDYMYHNSICLEAV